MCPFVEESDSRCAPHWTMREITSAFAHCADRYMRCPVYLEITAEKASDADATARFRFLAAS